MGLQNQPPINEIKIGLGNKNYFVGKSSIRHSKFVYRGLSDTRSEGNDLQILFFAALSLFCNGPVNNFKVVTGLPPGRMNLMEDLFKQIKTDPRNRNIVTIFKNNKPQEIEININQLEIVPQPLGTYWFQVLDLWGGRTESIEGRYGIIDVGFGTTDFATIEDGEYLPEKSRTISVGMATAYKEISEEIFARYGIERANHALDEVVIKGKINVAGKAIPITDIREEAFQKLATNVLVELNSFWRIPEYDSLLLSGGGGQAVSPYLLPYLPQGKLANEPITANSRGYLIWGNRLWKNASELDSGDGNG
jgi:plasmid segregation protein ParM